MSRKTKTQACGRNDCMVSTGICDRLTFGRGMEGDGFYYGYFDEPCPVCARAFLKDNPKYKVGDVWPDLTKETIMTPVEAMKIIGVKSSKFTTVELKKAFRAQSFLCHPDQGGTDNSFRELREAYEYLKSSASAPRATSAPKTETVEGRPLSELGKGYPITESARTCNVCSGAGYKTYHDKKHIRGTCLDCKGTGVFSYPCRTCRGEGHYKNPKTGKPAGTCKTCGGTGRFYPKHNTKTGSRWYKEMKMPNGTVIQANQCRKCDGRGEGIFDTDGDQDYYTYCRECSGIGEIKMWNPVIPRGLLGVITK